MPPTSVCVAVRSGIRTVLEIAYRSNENLLGRSLREFSASGLSKTVLIVSQCRVERMLWANDLREDPLLIL